MKLGLTALAAATLAASLAGAALLVAAISTSVYALWRTVDWQGGPGIAGPAAWDRAHAAHASPSDRFPTSTALCRFA